MKGDVHICATDCGAVCDYRTELPTNAGFPLFFHFEEVFAIMDQLINGLMHISQRGVLLLLLERAVHLRPPAPGQLLQGADIEIAVMEEGFQFGHVLDQEATVLADRIPAHRCRALGHIAGEKLEDLQTFDAREFAQALLG